MIYREHQQAALMPGLLADLMHPHRRHRPVHSHVHAAVFAGMRRRRRPLPRRAQPGSGERRAPKPGLYLRTLALEHHADTDSHSAVTASRCQGGGTRRQSGWWGFGYPMTILPFNS